MTWIELQDISQLDTLCENSLTKPCVIFKHSTRCSISHMALARLERAVAPEGTAFYFLDLIRFRALSDVIAERFGVHHESPQVLLIRNGACLYDSSHNGITMDELAEQIAA